MPATGRSVAARRGRGSAGPSVGVDQPFGDRELAQLQFQLLELLADTSGRAVALCIVELLVREDVGDFAPREVAIDPQLEQLALVFVEPIAERAHAVLHLRAQVRHRPRPDLLDEPGDLRKRDAAIAAIHRRPGVACGRAAGEAVEPGSQRGAPPECRQALQQVLARLREHVGRIVLVGEPSCDERKHLLAVAANRVGDRGLDVAGIALGTHARFEDLVLHEDAIVAEFRVTFTRMVTAPAILRDRIALGEWLGEGSLSVVHAGVDRVTGREVAIKLARAGEGDSSARRRFAREAAALSVIASPHVVELIAAGTTEDGRPYLVLERLHGHTLQDVVAELGPLAPGQVVRVVTEAARALELAHGLGIVHRDLKPANLFLHATPSQHAIVKVLDFGMVVDVEAKGERVHDAFGGTPLFMAPEQVRGQLTRIGPATDVWALAHVALALLTGESYWSSRTTEEILAEIESSPLEPPSLRWPWLPPAFDRWFARATRRVPERRFRDVAEQAASLADALRDVRAPARGRVPAVSATAETQLARPMLTPTPSVVRLGAQDVTVIGRHVECAEIETQLATGAIVTLVGPAGIGKTSLARAICERGGERFLDGAWFAALPPDGDADAVASAIAAALELEPDPTRSVLDHLVASLSPRRLLLAVDGVEHAPAAAEVIERLRRACPAVSWLATGRVPLGLAHERTFAIEPLDLPSGTPVDADEAMTYSAVALFVRCAQQASRAFTLDDDVVADVAAICRAVEGFPLGIVLAAARLKTSRLAEIRAALETSGDAAGVQHAVAWTYGLLSPDARLVLRHLALLPAGLTLAQVQDALADVVAEPRYAALGLVESQLLSWAGDRPRRLVMLESVREQCREATKAAGDGDTLWRVARRHVETIADRDAYSDEVAWLALLDAEHDNVQHVLAHLIETAPEAALGIAGRLAWYWYVRGHYADGARWLEEAIARSRANGEDMMRALHGAGRLALLRCQYQRAYELLERARELARARHDVRGEAEALQLLGSIARERGRYDDARALHGKARVLFEQLGAEREIGRTRNYLVFAAWLGDRAGDPGDEQRAWWCTEHEPELDPEARTWWLLDRGAILLHAGDAAAARDVIARAFAGAVAVRYREGMAWALDLLGRASFDRGEHVQAHAQLVASLQLHRRLGDRWRCASVLESLAAVAVATGNPARAAAYVGAADTIRAEIGTPVPACERARLADTKERGAAALGDAFATGCERGRRMSLDQALALAREGGGPASRVA